MLTTRDYPDDQYLIFATKSGTVKKTPLSEYSRPRSIGIIAINLREDDELVDVARTDGNRDIMLFSDAGKAVRFNENSVRSMGRDSTGVRGMNLDDGQRVIALCVVEEQGDILTITENGYGKLKIGDSLWTIHGDDLPAGTDIIITAAEDNRLHYRKAEK